jgi:LPPG:FO 2-phospho-L-lactate transferase
MICALTGGTGGAKFIQGLHAVLPHEDLVVIVNTGDDLRWWGLHVSPDVDSVTYAVAGLLSRQRGWGLEGDTFQCLEQMKRLGAPAWFQLGDRDLGTHLTRTQLLAAGKTLSEATAQITHAAGIRSRIVPMSDNAVETRVQTADGRDLSFQEFFVRERYQPAVRAVRFDGAEHAHPAPGVLAAIARADAIFLAPSNPITSIGPILAVPGIRSALCDTPAPVAAVSPIVGNAPVSGPAGALMSAHGFPVSIAGIAQAYSDFLDILIADETDAAAASTLRRPALQVLCVPTIMESDTDKAALARAALHFTVPDLAGAGAR